MATETPRVKLLRPDPTDTVARQLHLNDNWDDLDAAIDRVFTSTTRPATPYTGMMGFETDTKRRVLYEGTKWVYPDIVSVATATERNALPTYEGMEVYRIDKDWLEIFSEGAWRIRGVHLVDATANVPGPYTNQIINLNGVLYRYNGTSWEPLVSVGIHGRFRANANQSIPTGTWTKVLFPETLFSSPHVTKLAGNDGFTLNTTGVYGFSTSFRWVSNTSGSRHLAVSSFATNADRYCGNSIGAGTGAFTPSCGTERPFTAGDQVAVWVFQDSGGNLSSDFLGESNNVSITYLGKI